jgi:hypothetical protein
MFYLSLLINLILTESLSTSTSWSHTKFIEDKTIQPVLTKLKDLVSDEPIQIEEFESLLVELEDLQLVEFDQLIIIWHMAIL